MAESLSIVDKKDGKKIRLGIHWRKQWINFCSVQFLNDGSLVFSSKFHNLTESVSVGSAKQLNNVFYLGKGANEYKLDNGCHVTLHPVEQLMHFTKNSGGKILDTRKINWFPVNNPFNLLCLYSPPLELCVFNNKQPNFFGPFPDNYTNSVEVIVDIFPRETTAHLPYKNSEWIYWGYCPNYLVRISFNLSNTKTPAILIWPQDSQLGLLVRSQSRRGL